MYRAILFDLDGTLTGVTSIWRYLHERLGRWGTRAERHLTAWRRREISYGEFCRRDAACWRGEPIDRLRDLAGEIPLRPGCRELIAFLRRRGLRTGVISSGLTLLADRIAAELGTDYHIANHLESAAGRVTGRVDVRVSHGRKDVAVEAFCARFGLGPGQVIAVGDSEGDLSMFAAVGFSIAFRPTDEAAAAAADRVCRGERLTDLIPALPLGPAGPEEAEGQSAGASSPGRSCRR